MKKFLLSVIFAAMCLAMNAQCDAPTNLGYTCEEDPAYTYKYKVIMFWDAVENAEYYDLYINGSWFGQVIGGTSYMAGSDNTGTLYFQVMTICHDGESELSEPCTVVVGPTTSVSENEKRFEIYPNPVENQLVVNSDEKIQNIEVFTVAGKKVMEMENINNLLNVSELPQGMYFIKMRTENGEAVRRFIKK